MKKYLIILCMMFVPYFVNAKEACTVISGNGKDIGSEIACGSEHFYVIKDDEVDVKLLSKYNLYVGDNYDKIVLDINDTYVKRECIATYCDYYPAYYFENELVSSYEEWENKIAEKYGFDSFASDISSNQSYGNIAYYVWIKGPEYVEGEMTYQNSTYKLYPYTYIFEDTEGYAMQNELALGVVGEKGNANYPIYATLPLFGSYDGGMPIMSDFIKSYHSYADGFLNFEFQDDTVVKGYLNDYKNNLVNMGYDIPNVDIMNIEELNNLVHSISGEDLPLLDWYDESIGQNSIQEDDAEYYKLGDLKQFISNDYSWIWGTSYWMKTMAGNQINMNDWAFQNYMPYFVSSSGEICFSESNCWSGIPRAGIRPVVTVMKDDLKYLIRVKTDGNGTVEVIDSAFGNDSIQFKVSSKKGYKLQYLTIISDSGERVEFTEGEISNNNGIYSVDKNKFTMPFESVTIEARWATNPINPSTGVRHSILVISLIVIVGISLFFSKKNTCSEK